MNSHRKSDLSGTTGDKSDQAGLSEFDFGAGVEARLKHLDRDMAWLSRETGIATSTLGEMRAGRLPRVDRAVRIARALGIDVEALATEPSNGIGHGATVAAGRQAALPGHASPTRPPAIDELDLVQVNEIDLTYGLGAAFTDDPVETTVLHFPRVWLETISHSPPADLTFARGRGDSMQPTIQDGDIVLIDRSVRTVREQDAIWALTIGEFAMIKRLRLRGENVTILSDNDRVPDDQAHHEEINIVGRVIFIGRRL